MESTEETHINRCLTHSSWGFQIQCICFGTTEAVQFQLHLSLCRYCCVLSEKVEGIRLATMCTFLTNLENLKFEMWKSGKFEV